MVDKEHKGDIAHEEYQGSGKAVSALGLGAIETKVFALAGVALGAILGGFFAKPINGFAQNANKFADDILKRDQNTPGIMAACKRGGAYVMRWTFGAADTVAIGTLGGVIDKDAKATLNERNIAFKKDKKDAIVEGFSKMNLFKNFNNFGEKALAMVTLGGILGLIGFIGGMITGAFRGVSHAGHGAEQFSRAKKEIKSLREEKDALKDELEDSGKEVAKLKAKLKREQSEEPTATITQATLADRADAMEEGLSAGR